MRFTALIALVGLATAAKTTDVRKMALADQMKSLQNMVSATISQDSEQLISAISTRKEEL